jgi:hypothetical protein
MKHMTGRPQTFVIMVFLYTAIFAGCDFQNISMADYFKDHTATASGLNFTMNSETLNEPGGPILIPPGEDVSLKLILDNERKLDLRLALKSRFGRIDNVVVRKDGPEKVLITILEPSLWDKYALTLEIQDPYGLRTFNPYQFPEILCISGTGVLESLQDQIQNNPGAPGNPAVITIPGTAVLNAPVLIPAGSHIRLKPPAGRSISIERGLFNAELFIVETGSTLYLGEAGMTGNLVIDGKGIPVEGHSLICVGAGSALVLDSPGVTLTGAVNNGVGSGGNGSDSSEAGGAVRVDGGTLQMNAGTIKGNVQNLDSNGYNYGSAVAVKDGGVFTMTGGIIGGNSPEDANRGTCGTVYIENSTFIMSGSAKIMRNNGGDLGGGIYLTGVSDFTMKDNAEIARNVVEVPYAKGGGIYSDGQSVVTIEGGTIHDNRASDSGGGIYLNGSILYINSPAGMGSVYDNSASHQPGTANVGMESGAIFLVNGVPKTSY